MTRAGGKSAPGGSRHPSGPSVPGVRGAEKGEHGPDAVVIGICLIEPQFEENAGHVRFDRPGAQEELLGYPEVGPALGHVPEDRALALVERVDLARLPVPLQQAPDDGRVDHRFPVSHPSQAVHQGARVGDVVFQQVADAGWDGLQDGPA